MKTALTVAENLRILAALPRRAAARPSSRRSTRSGLAVIGHLPFGYLSAGQKRRAAIARLLASHRPVWLLDEPTAGLDARSDQEFVSLMREHLASGGIVVAATHQALGIEQAQGVAIAAGRGQLIALFLRDLRLGIRAGGGALTGVLFFLAVIATIPFAVGPDLNLLARIGPAILWIGALLASLLGLDRLFQADREDGSLDLMILSADRHMLALTVLGQMPGALDRQRAASGDCRAFARAVHEHRPASHRGGDADAARRHAGHHLHRRGRCGGRGRAAARRADGVGVGAAAHHPRADLRRLGELCRCRRAGSVPAALPALVRLVHHLRRGRPGGGGDRVRWGSD